MKRREFIAGLAGATAWPVVARAQERERMRRVGVFMSLPADDPQSSVRSAALLQALAEKGWTVGRNLQIDFRWATEDADRLR
jgi:putative ABC transport system substrate-binding protein